MRDDIDIPLPAMAPGGAGRAPRAEPGGYRVARGRAAVDPNTRRLAIIAAGIGAVFLAGIGGWSLLGHRHAGVPVIEADSRPVRSKPENAGGLQVAGQNESILSGDADSKAALAPAPEAPAPRALKDQEKLAAAASTVVPARPHALPPIPAAHPQPVAPVQAVALSQPVETHVKQVSKAMPAVAPASVAPAAHGSQVQLAALSSEEAALAEWQRLEKRLPDVLGGRKPGVARYERDGKTFWRLRTGGFADAAQAASFCDRLKSKGQSCTVSSAGA